MTVLVADSSALYEALLHPGAARRRIDGQRVCVPHLIDIEVASIVRKTTYKGEIDLAAGVGVIGLLMTTDLDRHDHTRFVSRLWELRHNLAPYDAVYVALAEWLQAPLVTVDGKLSRVPGLPVAVEVVPLAC